MAGASGSVPIMVGDTNRANVVDPVDYAAVTAQAARLGQPHHAAQFQNGNGHEVRLQSERQARTPKLGCSPKPNMPLCLQSLRYTREDSRKEGDMTSTPVTTLPARTGERSPVSVRRKSGDGVSWGVRRPRLGGARCVLGCCWTAWATTRRS